jgi:TatD DNase family protein
MIDSHCHLDHEPLLSNLDDVIQRSKDVGIKKILTICTTLESFKIIKNIIKNNEIIFGTYGIHPHETKKNKVTSNLIINEVNDNDKIIGIGETGLDFYYNHSDKVDQITSFEQHIKAAIDLNIPLIVHSRNAENQTLEIFEKYRNSKLKILMHCFTGSKNFAEKLLNFNAFFSASGIITFKNSFELQKTFEFIPLEKLLIETDSPFLAPEPNRGKKNEPSFIKYTAEKLAIIKNVTNENLINITSKNFNDLFN